MVSLPVLALVHRLNSREQLQESFETVYVPFLGGSSYGVLWQDASEFTHSLSPKQNLDTLETAALVFESERSLLAIVHHGSMFPVASSDFKHGNCARTFRWGLRVSQGCGSHPSPKKRYKMVRSRSKEGTTPSFAGSFRPGIDRPGSLRGEHVVRGMNVRNSPTLPVVSSPWRILEIRLVHLMISFDNDKTGLLGT